MPLKRLPMPTTSPSKRQKPRWPFIAAIATALLGGWLSHAYLPITAVHTAALLMVTAPAAVILATHDYQLMQRLEAPRLTLHNGRLVVR